MSGPIIHFDLRPAFLDSAMGRAGPVGPALDLRILSTLVEGGECVEEHRLASRMGVCALPGAERLAAIAERLLHSAVELGVNGVVDLEHELLPVNAGMVAHGLLVDPMAWRSLRVARSRQLGALRGKLGHELHLRDATDQRRVLAALRQRGFAVEGIGKDALAAHRGHPLIELVVSHSALAAFDVDTGPNVDRAIQRERDGRVRGNIDPLGTVTGRYTITEPNLLGLEKSDVVRRCVVAAPGNVLISTDIKSAELRVLAGLLEEEPLIEVFGRGQDPHQATAAAVFKVAPEAVTTAQRNLGKIVNFTIVFGGGIAAIVQQCAASRLTISEHDAQKFFEAFCEAYPRVAAWLDTSNDDLSVARSQAGRLRRFAGPDRSAWLNAPVQMTAADAMKFAIIALAPRLEEFGARIVLPVHDELVVEAPFGHAQEVARVVREVVIGQCEQTLDNVVKFDVEQFYGPSWAASEALWTYPEQAPVRGQRS